MRIEYCGLCDKGLKRAVNQDAIFMGAQQNKAIFVVADGMGGHRYGEVASGTIIAGIREWWEKLLTIKNIHDFEEIVYSFQFQMEQINRIIYKYYNHVNVCGATIVVLLIYKQKYYVFSSGDSRIYYWNHQNWMQLTEDDVWENLPEIKLNYNIEQQRRHVNYGKLTQAIGVTRNMVAKGRIGFLKKGDRFLLCSDGLYKMCEEHMIKKLLKKYRGKKNGNRLLVWALQKVYSNGAEDNIAVILVRGWM